MTTCKVAREALQECVRKWRRRSALHRPEGLVPHKRDPLEFRRRKRPDQRHSPGVFCLAVQPNARCALMPRISETISCPPVMLRLQPTEQAARAERRSSRYGGCCVTLRSSCARQRETCRSRRRRPLQSPPWVPDSNPWQPKRRSAIALVSKGRFSPIGDRVRSSVDAVTGKQPSAGLQPQSPRAAERSDTFAHLTKSQSLSPFDAQSRPRRLHIKPSRAKHLC